MIKEKWNEICFLLSDNIRTDISESDFEQNIIQALRVLDWKEFMGDIQIRPSLPVGASNRLTPDFIINSAEKKNLFVIEIKQPSIPLNSKFQQQLFSYMRQLKLEYGILIGQAIQIFYDGNLTAQDDPILLETIKFTKDNEKGENFAELFSKENYNSKLLNVFTSNSLEKIKRKAVHKKLTEKILSKDYQKNILELIKQDFLNEYDGELIDNVLQEISVMISRKNILIIDTPSILAESGERSEKMSTKDKTKYLFNGKILGKGKLVLEVVTEYLKRNPNSTFQDLVKKFPSDLQGSTGVINTVEFVTGKYANSSKKRHFMKESEILTSFDNIEFAVSTEWGIGNINKILELAEMENYEIEEQNNN